MSNEVCYCCAGNHAEVSVTQFDGTTSYYHTGCYALQNRTLAKYGMRVGMKVIWSGEDEFTGSILCISNEPDGDGHFLSLRNDKGGVDEVGMSLVSYIFSDTEGMYISYGDDPSDITRVHNDIEVSVDPENVYRMILACTNSNGEPDFAFVKVKCTSEDCDEYKDKSRAIKWAEENDYEAPFVVFNCTLDSAGKAIEDNFKWESASIISI